MLNQDNRRLLIPMFCHFLLIDTISCFSTCSLCASGLSLLEMLTGYDPITTESGDELPLMAKKDPNSPVPKERRQRHMAVIDVLAAVLHSGVPKLPSKKFSQPAENFVAERCVMYSE